jgi:hypothetical protein
MQGGRVRHGVTAARRRRPIFSFRPCSLGIDHGAGVGRHAFAQGFLHFRQHGFKFLSPAIQDGDQLRSSSSV